MLEKRYQQELSTAEQAEFDQLMDLLSEEIVSRIIDETIPVDMQMPFDKKRVFAEMRSEMNVNSSSRTRSGSWLKYAAALLLVGGLGFWFYQKDVDKAVDQTAVSDFTEVTLPEDHATVRLDNGDVYVVDESLDRLEISGVQVQRLEEGVYRFDVTAGSLDKKEEFYTFATPKGISNQVILSDGTKVWLNSSSQIQVSSHYNSGKRQVKVIGEAYFEVTNRSNQPFTLFAKGTIISVLGTMFNVCAWPALSEVETTLAEGKVQVSNPYNTLLLNPGQQAITSVNTEAIQKRAVDVDQVLAWKDGYFKFTEQPLELILEELLRWYDVDGVEWGRRTTDRLTLSLTRSRNLSELLKKIEMIADVELEVRERRIIVK